jgi:hypothetical protein
MKMLDGVDAKGFIFYSMVGGILTSMLSGFIKQLISFLLSLGFATRTTNSNGNKPLLNKLSLYVCEHMCKIQAPIFGLKRNFDQDDTTCETLVKGQRTVLASGVTFFLYGWRLMWVNTNISETSSRGRETTSCSISTFRWWSGHIDKLYTELGEKKETPEIFRYERRDWERDSDVPDNKRYISNTPDENEALQFVKNFQNDRQIYTEHGYRHKTGMLLYGPPGTGKNSFVYRMAIENNSNIYVVSPGCIKSAADLYHAIKNIADNSIVYFEDFDGAESLKAMDGSDDDDDERPHRGKRGKKSSAEAPTKILQSILDGSFSPNNGTKFVFSTNNLDKLKDESGETPLIRPGRIEMTLEIGYATKKWVTERFLLDFPGAVEQATTLAKKLNDYTVVQSAFSQAIFTCIRCKKTVDETVEIVFKAIVKHNEDQKQKTE